MSTPTLDPYLLVEAVPVPAYASDPVGRILHANREAVALWGRAPSTGETLESLWRKLGVEREDGTPVLARDSASSLALRDGLEHTSAVLVFTRPDARRVRFAEHVHSLQDAQGGNAGVLVVTLEERSQDSEAALRLGAIVRDSDDAIVSKSLEGIVRTWNPAAERMFGYSADEMIGRSIIVIIPPELLHEEEEVLSRMRRGDRIEHFETRRRRKDGTLIDISLTVSPIRDESGIVVGVSKIARDVTERKRVEALLAESSRQKDEFIAILAHELRNPLAPISNAVQILKLEGVGWDMVVRARDVITRQVNQMVRLVDDLMDVSRLTRNELIVRKRPIDLAFVIHHALEAARPLLSSAGQEIEVRLPEEPVYVDADLARLSQAFMNLLHNAVKFTPKGGHIWIETKRDESWIEVRVRDDGAGIPPEMLDRIFDMFTQVNRSLERAQGGLGIGLSLARQLVTMHGGTLEARSAGTGRGSEFVVRLPMLVGWSPEGEVKPERGEVSARTRILVADDNVDSAMTLAALLRLQGHDVRTANDGLAAFREIEQFRPQLALLDIGMPKLNGYELARRIRAAPWGRDMLLAAVTGWGQETDRRRSTEAGFDFHFVKPVDVLDLESLMTRAQPGEPGEASRARNGLGGGSAIAKL